MSIEPTDTDDGMLAAEYALGLLTREEHDAAARRAANDAAFAQLVTEWEIQLSELADDLPLENLSPSVKRALMDEVFGAREPQGLLTAKWLWPLVSALSLAALAVVLVLEFAGRPAAEGPLYSAEIVSAEGDFRVTALVDKTTNEVVLTRTRGAAPDGRILQVWAHGEGEPAISVGLWPEGETVRLPMPPTIAAVEGILTLGVSEEPPGGSVTGSPSGRIFGTVDIPGVTAAF